MKDIWWNLSPSLCFLFFFKCKCAVYKYDQICAWKFVLWKFWNKRIFFFFSVWRQQISTRIFVVRYANRISSMRLHSLSAFILVSLYCQCSFILYFHIAKFLYKYFTSSHSVLVRHFPSYISSIVFILDAIFYRFYELTIYIYWYFV